jgi:GNAT superfamily N-acetyltransferase
MAHKAEHSEIIELNDGALGVKFLCCGDPKSVQSHTFMVREDHTDADYEKWLADRYAEVEKAARAERQGETVYGEVQALMELRTLEASEYPVLCQVDDGFTPDPNHSIAIIAKDGEEIVGRIFLLSPVHLEGPWIREDRRGMTLAARLVAKAEQEAKACGVTKLFAYAANAEMVGYLVTVWAKELT